MIQGYFASPNDGRALPFVEAILQFPDISWSLDARFLVDTGTDRTVLSPHYAIRMAVERGIDFASLPQGEPLFGIGGTAENRVTAAVIQMDTLSIPFMASILEPSPPQVPFTLSVLGRDILARFALFMEERTGRVLLLEPQEADALNLPSSDIFL